MKKLVCLFLLCGLLSGCAAPTFETLGDVQHEQAVAAAPCEIRLDLPKNAQAMGNSYFCDGFYLELQTMDSGDLDATVRAVSGFPAKELTVLTASTGELRRYEWVWSAAGEEGEVICRAAVIDDGSFHYCLTAIAPAQKGGEFAEIWNQIFASFEAAQPPA